MRDDYFQGSIEFYQPNCRPRITKAPERTAISLALILAADPKLVTLSRLNELAFPNANYMVVGWDDLTASLLLERTWFDEASVLKATAAEESDG